MSLQTQTVPSKSSKDIFAVQPEKPAVLWEGPHRPHSLQAVCRKLQEGAGTRPIILQREIEQQ